jgi:restriction system protein
LEKRVAKKENGQAEFVRWMGPLLECLRAAGGSAKPREVSAWIRQELKLPDTLTEASLKSGANRFHNQVQWARQYLVWEGLIDDAKRGVWSLTPLGWKTHLDDKAARAVFLDRVAISQRFRKDAKSDIFESTPPAAQEGAPPDDADEQELLDVLKALPPYGFERLCVRLLHEHGFEDVRVTQQSRDGGIDGLGVLRLSPFVGVKVAFQAKKYANAVSSPEIRNFRGALSTQIDKAVLITTGRFTRDAEAEASKTGAFPIELIDGERLVELFQSASLGVKQKQAFEIDQAFFDQFRGK